MPIPVRVLRFQQRIICLRPRGRAHVAPPAYLLTCHSIHSILATSGRKQSPMRALALCSRTLPPACWKSPGNFPSEPIRVPHVLSILVSIPLRVLRQRFYCNCANSSSPHLFFGRFRVRVRVRQRHGPNCCRNISRLPGPTILVIGSLYINRRGDFAHKIAHSQLSGGLVQL
jgi:hypothetical protein